MFFLLLIFPILIPIYCYCSYVRRISPLNKAVLITGCDTGFGRSLAIKLSNRGFRVLAACLLNDSLENLRADPLLNDTGRSNIQPFQCDVTREEDIARSVEVVSQLPSSVQLWALVNNAGIIDGAIIHWTSMEQFHRVMNVNFFGQVAMVKAHLATLIKTRGRIINMASILGFTAVPALAAYCSSKFALEGFSDSLRREMKPFGVGVSVIEPGLMNTAIVDSAMNAFNRSWDNLEGNIKSIYGEGYKQRAVKNFKNYIKIIENPEKVVSGMMHAVESPWPRIRYLTGWQAKMTWLGQMYSDGVMDWMQGLIFPNRPDTEAEKAKSNAVQPIMSAANSGDESV